MSYQLRLSTANVSFFPIASLLSSVNRIIQTSVYQVGGMGFSDIQNGIVKAIGVVNILLTSLIY